MDLYIGGREMEQPNFCFQKKVGLVEDLYGNIPMIIDLIHRLLFCIKETNKLHETESEFFRLDFRQPYFHEMWEFPKGYLILDLKWGCKKELEEKYKA